MKGQYLELPFLEKSLKMAEIKICPMPIPVTIGDLNTKRVYINAPYISASKIIEVLVFH
jgi:hypothetical protein